jgi:hypothetical protein
MINLRKLRKSVLQLKKRFSQQKRFTNEMVEDAILSAAEFVKDESVKRTPVDEGYVESAHYVDSEYNDDEIFVAYIAVDENLSAGDAKVGDYAQWLHEGSYELGKNSRLKQQSQKVKVGRKFLERAFKENQTKIQEIVISKLKRE